MINENKILGYFPVGSSVVNCLMCCNTFLEGFTDRSKIKVDFEIPDDFGRLPQDLETTIFRVIHFYANMGVVASKGNLRYRTSGMSMHIRETLLADQGKDIPPEKKAAMNSAGMPGVPTTGSSATTTVPTPFEVICNGGHSSLFFSVSGSDYNAGLLAPLCDTTSFRAQSPSNLLPLAPIFILRCEPQDHARR
jgi:hypothetical protein